MVLLGIPRCHLRTGGRGGGGRLVSGRETGNREGQICSLMLGALRKGKRGLHCSLAQSRPMLDPDACEEQ